MFVEEYAVLLDWTQHFYRDQCAQMPDSKNTFSPNSNNQNYFFKKNGWYTFFLLYMWAKYELIWSNITAQTVTLGAKILKNIKSNPRNPK